MQCAAVGALWVDVDEAATGLYCMMSNGINLNENTVFLEPLENGGVQVLAFFILEMVLVVWMLVLMVTRLAVVNWIISHEEFFEIFLFSGNSLLFG